MAWLTARPPRDWNEGDLLFFWKGAPACEVVGLGELMRTEPKARRFQVRYTSSMFERPLSLENCRRDPVLRTASFVKAGAGGTVFPLTPDQATRLRSLVRRENPKVTAAKRPARRSPRLALSIRQPWAELILRGEKTMEVRSRRTHVREPVFLYASRKRIDPARERWVAKSFGMKVDDLPRGVIVGVIELRGCRPLRRTDSKLAAFPIGDPGGDWAWEVVKIRRLKKPRKPKGHPQPSFFRPF